MKLDDELEIIRKIQKKSPWRTENSISDILSVWRKYLPVEQRKFLEKELAPKQI